MGYFTNWSKQYGLDEQRVFMSLYKEVNIQIMKQKIQILMWLSIYSRQVINGRTYNLKVVYNFRTNEVHNILKY